MSSRRLLPDHGTRRRYLSAGTRVALLGMVGVLAIVVATWIGSRDTQRISTGLEDVAATSDNMNTLRRAKAQLEEANADFAEGVDIGGLEGLRSISSALSHFDEGIRSWREFEAAVPPVNDADAAARADLNERVTDLRAAGETLAAMVMTQPLDDDTQQVAQAAMDDGVAALRADFDIIDKAQADQLQEQVSGLGDTVDAAHRLVLIGGLTAIAAALLATAIASTRAARREREREAAATERDQINRRNALDASLQAALDMAESEDHAISVVRRALAEALPGRSSVLLLADAPSAEMVRVAASDPDELGCLVPSPDRCPAARHGQRLVFATPSALNACFYLQDRPGGACSAVCAPVNVAGRAVGVVHVTAPERRPPGDHEIASIDVIARKASERLGTLRAFGTITTQARTDPLTGLLNRRSIDGAMEELDRTSTPYATAFADLDHFKALNDTHGHPTGDKALQLFAHVLRSSVRPGDLVGRYGGEEFLLVFPECAVDEAVRVLERVQANLAVALAGSTIPPFTASFGVAAWQSGRAFGDVVAAADVELLAAKSAGRNRIIGEAAPGSVTRPGETF